MPECITVLTTKYHPKSNAREGMKKASRVRNRIELAVSMLAVTNAVMLLGVFLSYSGWGQNQVAYAFSRVSLRNRCSRTQKITSCLLEKTASLATAEEIVTENDESSKTSTKANMWGTESLERRSILRTGISLAIGSLSFGIAPAARAGEVGARITKAVTTSDLGISVRTSVVRGAQFADKIDGEWEKFSDKYGLGTERTKAKQQRQASSTIPDPLPLDIPLAQKILIASDEIFLATMARSSIDSQKLAQRIEKIATSAKSSFERSGLELPAGDDVLKFETAPQFNFVVYSHYKAYSEFILENASVIDFASFRTEFEARLGRELIKLLGLQSGLAAQTTETAMEQSERLKNQLLDALARTDLLADQLRDYGLVSRMGRTKIEFSPTEELQDFVDDALAELVIGVTIDGDATLQSQILLQEQGYRLYPNFNRYIVTELFEEALKASMDAKPRTTTTDEHKVSVMDYYFDTDYNSDPDKFDVKQVLLNISIE